MTWTSKRFQTGYARMNDSVISSVSLTCTGHWRNGRERNAFSSSRCGIGMHPQGRCRSFHIDCSVRQLTGWNFHCAFGGSQFTGWHSHQLAGSVGCLCQPVYWLTLWSGCSCLCQPVYWLALSSCGLCQPVYWLTHSHHAACVSQFTGWHFDRAAAACVSQFTGWHSHHAARVSQFTGWHFDHLGCNMLHVTNFAPNLSSCKRWLDIKQHQAVNIAKLDDFCQRAKVVWGLSELTRSWPHFFEFF